MQYRIVVATVSAMTQPVARRTPTARHARLLADLVGLFLAEGFAAFTLDDLAARMRCSKSTLYALAPSKEQLAVKVVGHFFRQATEGIEDGVAGQDDPRAQITAYLDGAADALAPASAAFIADVANYPPTAAIYRRNAQAAAGRIKTFIAGGVEAGVFREVHATLIAEMVGLLIESIQAGVLGTRAGVSDAEAFTALSELVLGGLDTGGPEVASDPGRR